MPFHKNFKAFISVNEREIEEHQVHQVAEDERVVVCYITGEPGQVCKISCFQNVALC